MVSSWSDTDPIRVGIAGRRGCRAFRSRTASALKLSFLAALAVATLSCASPPGTDRSAQMSTVAREFGALPVFITSQLTDGRNVKLRGKIRNPYAESISGIRLIYVDLAPGTPARVLGHALHILDLELGSGQDTPLRWDIQTTYAGSPGAHFNLMAFAIKRGGQDLPLPPGWEKGDDEVARSTH